MPFNGTGTFSIINTFVSGTTILSSAVNQNFSDIASGLSDVLTRDGQAGMTAVLKIIAGSVSAPGLAFTTDPNTGMYLVGADNGGLTAGGVQAANWTAAGWFMSNAVYETADINSASLGSDQNNYAPTGIDTASTIRLTSSTTVNITGLAGAAGPTAPADGRRIRLINIGSNNITLKANSSSSTAANRFGFAADLVLYTTQGVDLWYDSTSSLWRITGSHQFVSTAPQGNVQLQLSSSTVVKLVPYQGNFVSFPSGAVATIASAGISSTFNNASVNGTAAQTLSNTTLYYAYLWDSGSGTYVIDWSTTGHATDTTTGIEIKSGDATRVLVGMAYLVGGNFLDSATNRLVVSWFNRLSKYMQNSFTTTRTTTSATVVEINTEIRCNFLSWATAFNASYAGTAQNSNASALISTVIGLDGVATLVCGSQAQITANNTIQSCNVSGHLTTTEGFHFITIGGAASAGTTTFNNTANSIPAYLSASLNI